MCATVVFDVKTTKDSRVVESVACEGIKVFFVVKRSVQHSTVVLPRTDQNGGSVAPQEVVRIQGVSRQKVSRSPGVVLWSRELFGGTTN